MSSILWAGHVSPSKQAFLEAKLADASAARLADEAVRAAQAEVTSHQPAMRSGLKERKAPASSDSVHEKGAPNL